MPQAQQQRIDEILKHDPWYSPTDTRLDLSQYPHLVPLTDASFEDDKFSQPDQGRGSNDLKRFVTDQLEQGQPDSVVHVGEAEFKVSRKDGAWHARGRVAGQIHRFTGSTREEVLSKLVAVAKSPRAEGHQFRELSDDEALHITRLAQSGDEPTAFGQYFLSRIGPHVATMEDPMTELLSNPTYRSICDQAAFFVWAARNDNYVPNAEFEQMVARVAELKPLNGRLLTSIWIQYLDEKQARPSRPDEDAPASEEPAEPDDLNDLSDDQINDVFRQTVRESARFARRHS